mmetsp:Transcript_14256/g.15465  ORF Transcript_14256/g.15465 Transcript_14256/m.15465 type:complete len:105 (-) Transcript_14256:106-420(-)
MSSLVFYSIRLIRYIRFSGISAGRKAVLGRLNRRMSHIIILYPVGSTPRSNKRGDGVVDIIVQGGLVFPNMNHNEPMLLEKLLVLSGCWLKNISVNSVVLYLTL